MAKIQYNSRNIQTKSILSVFIGEVIEVSVFLSEKKARLLLENVSSNHFVGEMSDCSLVHWLDEYCVSIQRLVIEEGITHRKFAFNRIRTITYKETGIPLIEFYNKV